MQVFQLGDVVRNDTYFREEGNLIVVEQCSDPDFWVFNGEVEIAYLNNRPNYNKYFKLVSRNGIQVDSVDSSQKAAPTPFSVECLQGHDHHYLNNEILNVLNNRSNNTGTPYITTREIIKHLFDNDHTAGTTVARLLKELRDGE